MADDSMLFEPSIDGEPTFEWPRTRDEHMAWCKQRALEYVEQGDLPGALASLTSDFAKHPQTKPLIPFATMLGMSHVGSRAGMLKFIMGFRCES